MDSVIYYHVELEHHDVSLAEGLPAESYLDTGDRCNFENGGGPIPLHPEFSPRRWDTALMWEGLACAPLIVAGLELGAARALVNSRVAAVAHDARAA
jgi:collagen type I alpha